MAQSRNNLIIGLAFLSSALKLLTHRERDDLTLEVVTGRVEL